MFGVSSQRIGRWLMELSLRTGRTPTPEALETGLAQAITDEEMTFYSWNKVKVVPLLEQVAHKPPAVESQTTLQGPFTVRPNDGDGDGYEIVGGDGKVGVWVRGKANAEIVALLMNVGHKHGKFGEQDA
jgi:hypothetical protein